MMAVCNWVFLTFVLLARRSVAQTSQELETSHNITDDTESYNFTSTTEEFSTVATLQYSTTLAESTTLDCLQMRICDSKYNTSDLLIRNCMCDEECPIYGDCCSDSVHFTETEQLNFFSYTCYKVHKTSYMYVKSACPHNAEEYLTSMCKEFENRNAPNQHFLTYTPVTSTITNITYGNMYCALCNSETEFDIWQLECNETEFNESDMANMWQNVVVDKNEVYWYKKNNQDCKIRFEPSENAIFSARYCIPNLISSCNKEASDEHIFGCKKSMSAVYSKHEKVKYRNIHCALCNGISESNVSYCLPPDFVLTRARSRPLGSLFAVHSRKKFSVNTYCNIPQKETLYKHICHKQTNDSRNHPPDKKLEIGNIYGRNCLVYYFQKADVKIQDEILHAPNLELNYTKEKYIIYNNNDTVGVCVKDIEHEEETYYQFLGILTTVCLVISCICIVIHIIIFYLVPSQRNISGKCLTSLSVALLFAYISFLFGNNTKTTWCFYVAISTYYFFLASFFWMLIISFDLWFNLWKAVKKLRAVSKKHNKRFVTFSIFCWLFPAVIVSFSIIVESCDSGPLAEYKPNFGKGNCWFGNERGLFVFFTLPFAIIMITNLILFIYTAFLIYVNQRKIVAASSNTRQDFKLYLRLALLMGLTWIVALLTAKHKNAVLEAVFVLLNSTQGLFIFIAFSCKGKVYTALLRRYHGGPVTSETRSTELQSRHTSGSRRN